MKASLAFAILAVSLPAAAAHMCDHTNAFHPEAPVIAERCMADLTAPVWTREGALVCQDEAGLAMASNAMSRGWIYVPTAGYSLRNVSRGQPVTAANFGCVIAHSGVALQIAEGDRVLGHPGLHSSIGWIQAGAVQNSPGDEIDSR